MTGISRIPCVPFDVARLRLTTTERKRELRRLLDLRKSKFTSIALFFNLGNPTGTKNVNNYRVTATSDVQAWLHLGEAITTSQFVQNYWSALSYGQFVPSVDANRDASGNILIPTINPASGDGQDWGNIADQIARANAQQIWQMAGSLTDGPKRIIPSMVVVQNYDTNASALVGDWGDEFSVGGQTYHIVHLLHLHYDTSRNEFNLPGSWGTLCHEYSHNFLGGYDLYGGGGGKIGYWDILGDNCTPGHMSDTSSYHKNNMTWISYKAVLNGPMLPPAQYSLKPYASSGEAIQVIPDPIHNPGEYFLLEYRTQTVGNTAWTPDGAIQESGLLITHINERLGDGAGDAVSSSPFMELEEADRNDGKCWSSRAHCDLPWSDPPNARAGDPGSPRTRPITGQDGSAPPVCASHSAATTALPPPARQTAIFTVAKTAASASPGSEKAAARSFSPYR
jgi:M6 family metalloprotease-like protein